MSRVSRGKACTGCGEVRDRTPVANVDRYVWLCEECKAEARAKTEAAERKRKRTISKARAAEATALRGGIVGQKEWRKLDAATSSTSYTTPITSLNLHGSDGVRIETLEDVISFPPEVTRKLAYLADHFQLPHHDREDMTSHVRLHLFELLGKNGPFGSAVIVAERAAREYLRAEQITYHKRDIVKWAGVDDFADIDPSVPVNIPPNRMRPESLDALMETPGFEEPETDGGLPIAMDVLVIDRAMRAMTATARAFIVLAGMGLSDTEIADRLNMTPAAAKKARQRAVTQMQKMIGE